MPDLSGFGKLLMVLGGALALAGLLLTVAGKILGPGEGVGFGWLGRLPGDMYIKRDNFTFYFPLTTGILISVVVSLLWYLVSFVSRR